MSDPASLRGRQFGVRLWVAEQFRDRLESGGDIKAGYTNAAGTMPYFLVRVSAGRDLAASPIGYRDIWAGEFEGLQATTARLEVIVPINLVL